uniref:Uncharacterized protein n=1 Tax=Meloidogyne enterolobii TaxID=390850 RepID=A0A6V7V995_MELEN|nr:unnamed protein product [Meloidogyne enterolobii]
MLISIILTFLLLINNKNCQVYATQEQQQFSRQVRPYSERAANQNLLDGSMSMDEFDNTDPFYRAARENGVKWMRFGKRVPQQSKWMRFGKRAPSSGKWMRFGKRNSEFMEEK